MSEINPFLNYGATSLENLKDFCRKTVQEKIDAAACRKDMVWTMDKDYKLTGFNDLFYQRLKKENSIEIDKIILLISELKFIFKLLLGKKPPEEIIVSA